MSLRIRQTFAAHYANCPMAAKLGRDRAAFSTHQQARGTLIHQFAETVVRECVENDEPAYPPEQAKVLMGELIAKTALPVPPEEHADLMDMAWRFAAERTFDVENVVDLETTYTLEVDGVTITGKPDYLAIEDRVGTVVDFKSSWVIDPEASARGTFQGRLYGRMLFEAFPQLAAVKVVLDPVRWGVKARREALLTRSDLPDIDDYLRGLVARILRSEETDEWEPSPGSWCSYCPAHTACPIPAEERGEGALTSPARAREAAEWAVATEARLRATKKALRAYADNPDNDREVLAVGDLTFGFKRNSDGHSCIDYDALKLAMGRAGLDWEAHFKARPGAVVFRAHKRQEAA